MSLILSNFEVLRKCKVSSFTLCHSVFRRENGRDLDVACCCRSQVALEIVYLVMCQFVNASGDFRERKFHPTETTRMLSNDNWHWI
jgi:hypothetical protein